MMRVVTLLIGLIISTLTGCATAPPFSDAMLAAVDRGLMPEQVVQNQTREVRVLWGGVIIGSVNMPDHTDFNVLFYPLDKSQRPDLELPAHSRFIVRYPGYLETMVYAPGREITILGTLQGTEAGKVGDAPYDFPVLQAEQLHLWQVGDDSRVRFGIGVGVGVHM